MRYVELPDRLKQRACFQFGNLGRLRQVTACSGGDVVYGISRGWKHEVGHKTLGFRRQYQGIFQLVPFAKDCAMQHATIGHAS